MGLTERKNLKDAAKEARYERRRINAIKAMTKICQEMQWSMFPNVRETSEDPILGFTIGAKEWVVYNTQLQSDDLKKQREEEAAEEKTESK